MEYRNIFVTIPARICVQRGQLVIEQAEKIAIPLEDISAVLIETQQALLTAHSLAELATHGITVLFCDEKHLPCCQLLAINRFSRQRKLLMAQLSVAKPLQKQLWQQIVKRKIENQAACIRLSGKDGWEYLLSLSKSVLSDDSDNREAVAAAMYFPALFGEGFTRNSDDPRNAALNYGYSIIRGCIARNLTVHGLEPCIGIHHHNELNNFNLADDLIEPFRPIVDLYVANHFSSEQQVLTPEQKAGLFNITNYMVIQGKKKYRVMLAADRVCACIASGFSHGQFQLELPELLPLEMHCYE